MNIRLEHVGPSDITIFENEQYIGFIRYKYGVLTRSSFLNDWLKDNPLPDKIKEAELMLRVKNI